MIQTELRDVLTDIEKVKIEAFCKDEELLFAVKKVLLETVYSQGVVSGKDTINPLINSAFHLANVSMTNPIPDAEIGANVRAIFAGVNALKNGFDKLESIRVESKINLEELNEAV